MIIQEERFNNFKWGLWNQRRKTMKQTNKQKVKHTNKRYFKRGKINHVIKRLGYKN